MIIFIKSTSAFSYISSRDWDLQIKRTESKKKKINWNNIVNGWCIQVAQLMTDFAPLPDCSLYKVLRRAWLKEMGWSTTGNARKRHYANTPFLRTLMSKNYLPKRLLASLWLARSTIRRAVCLIESKQFQHAFIKLLWPLLHRALLRLYSWYRFVKNNWTCSNQNS